MEEQRRREEEARLEAMRQAEIEKARAEAEHRARMEALTSQQAHEQELAKHKPTSTRSACRSPSASCPQCS